MTGYLQNEEVDLHVARGYSIPQAQILEAIAATADLMSRFRDFEVDVFSLLGMRNLSAFVGEAFCASLSRVCGESFARNPHQDGYPDLLLLDEEGGALWRSLDQRRREKEPFSPFMTGGVEIKATCGSTPSARALAQRGLTKPGMGDNRIALMTSFDWKAHHRDTNNLLGILWDFIDGLPVVVAAFYSNQLTEQHWGGIVQPRAGGGRTTSVSIMNRRGIDAMCRGWVACIQDRRYIDFLNRRNRRDLIPSRW